MVISMEDKDYYYSFKDPKGREVRMTKRTLDEHILNRKDMSLEDIRRTVENTDSIHRSKSDNQTEVYFSDEAPQCKRSGLTAVIVWFLSAIGMVRTAYPARNKNSAGEHLWSKED